MEVHGRFARRFAAGRRVPMTSARSLRPIRSAGAEVHQTSDCSVFGPGQQPDHSGSESNLRPVPKGGLADSTGSNPQPDSTPLGA